jgi:hypothetical protein
VRTTVELPDDLFREAKASAARRGITIKVLFREALEAALPAGRRSPGRPPLGIDRGRVFIGDDFNDPVPEMGGLDIPDELMRKVKAAAKAQATTIDAFLCSALAEKLSKAMDRRENADPRWPVPPMDLTPDEAAEIDDAIEDAFEQVEPEDWA